RRRGVAAPLLPRAGARRNAPFRRRRVGRRHRARGRAGDDAEERSPRPPDREFLAAALPRPDPAPRGPRRPLSRRLRRTPADRAVMMRARPAEFLPRFASRAIAYGTCGYLTENKGRIDEPILGRVPLPERGRTGGGRRHVVLVSEESQAVGPSHRRLAAPKT